MLISGRGKSTGLAMLLGCALLMTGCKPDKAVKTSENLDQNATPAAAPAVPANAGEITGVVNFKGTPPPRIKIDMSMDPACAMVGGENLTEQYIVDHGKLANVYVYVKSGIAPSKAPAGMPVAVMDQKGCRYVPHMLAVQQGGMVKFENSDPTMHNIHTIPEVGGNRVMDVSQGPGASPETKMFEKPEVMIPVRCNNHPWMNAFINVSPNPYFAVTGTDGSFTIKNLPPGTYTLAAVHEKLGEQDIQVTVPAKGTAKAEFSFQAK